MPRLVSTAALLAVLAPMAAHAQAAPAPASSLPAPLVTALMSDGSRRMDPATTYFVGALPAEWPSSVAVPVSAVVVGGMTTPSTLIAVFDMADPRAVAVFDSVFEKDGWSHPARRNSQLGFQSDVPSMTNFCRDSAYISANTVPGARGRHYVMVRYIPSSVSNSCSVAEKRFVTPGALVIPRLVAPSGSHSPGGDGHGGQDEQQASTTIRETTLTPKQLIDHYATQLAAAGWTGTAAAVTDRAAVQPFDARDASGAAWAGALIVTAREKMLDVMLSMHRVMP